MSGELGPLLGEREPTLALAGDAGMEDDPDLVVLRPRPRSSIRWRKVTANAEVSLEAMLLMVSDEPVVFLASTLSVLLADTSDIAKRQRRGVERQADRQVVDVRAA